MRNEKMKKLKKPQKFGEDNKQTERRIMMLKISMMQKAR